MARMGDAEPEPAASPDAPRPTALPPDWRDHIGKPLDPDFAVQVEASLDTGAPAPVVRGIPRFVESDHYAGSFSFQWTTYTDTQLDSRQGVDLTAQDLILKTGLTPEEVKGRLVLDAGVGTGRHAELLASWGARVVGVDLSEAVETARDNLARFPNALVMQADIGALPFRPESFDFIYSIGVLHHTPDTRAYAEKLLRLLKPGGGFCLWVYPPKFERRGEWVPLVSRLPPKAFQAWCEWVIDIARSNRGKPWMEAFIRQFPFATHHPTAQRSVLALFDGYTPTYHWTHSPDEVAGWFREWGLEDVRKLEEPTAVRGRKPGG
jgi:SAM-dependent methyltransferase